MEQLLEPKNETSSNLESHFVIELKTDSKECNDCGVLTPEYHYLFWSKEEETGYISDLYLCDPCYQESEYSK